MSGENTPENEKVFSFFGENFSYFERFWNSIFLFFEDFLVVFKDNFFQSEEHFNEFFEGSKLQRQVLQAFALICILNVCFICVAWRVFSSRISVALSSNKFSVTEEEILKRKDLK